MQIKILSILLYLCFKVKSPPCFSSFYAVFLLILSFYPVANNISPQSYPQVKKWSNPYLVVQPFIIPTGSGTKRQFEESGRMRYRLTTDLYTDDYDRSAVCSGFGGFTAAASGL